MKPSPCAFLRCAFLSCTLCACLPVAAQVPPAADTHRFEPVAPPPAPVRTGPQLAPVAPAPEAVPPLPSLMQRDSAQTLAQHISQLVQQQQWQRLAEALALYARHPQADPAVLYYGQGALYRHQKNYAQAIAAYEALLRAHPALPYVRLDLALMQAEDRQYQEAIAALAALAQDPHSPPPVQQLAQRYLEQLRKVYTLDIQFNATYTRNDNVNQASPERTIVLNGLTFVKNEDSLPKVGHGIHYGLRLHRQFALKGHHSIALDARYGGVHYWDQHDYSERTLRLAPVYQYQSYHYWVNLGPVAEKNWLGGKSYSTHLGVQLEAGRRLTEKHTLIPHIEHLRKRYDDAGLRRYEGNNTRSSLTWAYQPNAQTTLWGRGEHQRDALLGKTESSTRLALSAGGRYRFANGLNLQAQLQAGRRVFGAKHALFNVTRRDQERTASISLWHSKLEFMGISPKLVYTWRDIRSNLPALYSRTSKGFTLEMVDVRF